MMRVATTANASAFIASSIVVSGSVSFFDVNFDFHLACALEGQGEREILVTVERFDEPPQQDVRPIGIELDRSPQLVSRRFGLHHWPFHRTTRRWSQTAK